MKRNATQLTYNVQLNDLSAHEDDEAKNVRQGIEKHFHLNIAYAGVLSLLFLALSGLAILIADWWSVAPQGSVGPRTFLHQMSVLSLIATPIAAVACAFKQPRQIAGCIMVSCLLFQIAFRALAPIGQQMRSDALHRVASRGDILAEAIEAYTRDNGKLLKNLENLVPKYLDAVPSTGVGAYPEFCYRWNDPSNSWSLMVLIYDGSDRSVSGTLVYWPDVEYPETYERYGNWAFSDR